MLRFFQKKIFALVWIVAIINLYLMLYQFQHALHINDGLSDEDTLGIKSKDIEVYLANFTSNRHLPKRTVFEVDCKILFEGDTNEIHKANLVEKSVPKGRGTPHKTFWNIFEFDCQSFKVISGFNILPSTAEERNFPLAFSLLFHEDVPQVLSLLKVIYRPHNKYCLHVDTSASAEVKRFAAIVTQCIPNVFLVSESVDVVYASFSRLEAELNCMKDLLRDANDWEYFINLPGSEYPLRTNAELVKILKIYNGSNDIEGITKTSRMLRERYKFIYNIVDGRVIKTNQTHRDPPHSIKIVKGSAYGVFSRAFAEFVIKDRRVQDFLSWCQKIYSPDEYFWATLNHDKSLKAPGGYHDEKPWLAAYALWQGSGECGGEFVRGVCVFGPRDLNTLASRKELFANKFRLISNPVTLRCMEEWLVNRTLDNQLPFDTYFYRNLPFIQK